MKFNHPFEYQQFFWPSLKACAQTPSYIGLSLVAVIMAATVSLTAITLNPTIGGVFTLLVALPVTIGFLSVLALTMVVAQEAEIDLTARKLLAGARARFRCCWSTFIANSFVWNVGVGAANGVVLTIGGGVLYLVSAGAEPSFNSGLGLAVSGLMVLGIWIVGMLGAYSLQFLDIATSCGNLRSTASIQEAFDLLQSDWQTILPYFLLRVTATVFAVAFLLPVALPLVVGVGAIPSGFESGLFLFASGGLIGVIQVAHVLFYQSVSGVAPNVRDQILTSMATEEGASPTSKELP
jgi:hypothetical protein